MRSIKIFNNNAVSAITSDGREAILLGNGIGFAKRPGSEIDESRIEKVYYVQTEMQTKFLEMLQDVSPDVMSAAEEIIRQAGDAGMELSNQATISLIDHIGFAIERFQTGILLPNTYLNYYLQCKEFVEHSDPTHTRANEVMETREKNLFDGIDKYLATGEIDEKVFYAGSHGDWIAYLAIALKNDTKARFLVITENRGCIPNMPYDAMVEVPAYIGKNGPEVITQKPIPLFQQGLMMQQVNSEKLLVQGCIEGSYEKVLQAFTLNKTVPSMNVAKAILDDMIEANKEYWPELH